MPDIKAGGAQRRQLFIGSTDGDDLANSQRLRQPLPGLQGNRPQQVLEPAVADPVVATC